MQTVKEFVYAPDPSEHWNFVSVVKETNKSMHMQGPNPDAAGFSCVPGLGKLKSPFSFSVSTLLPSFICSWGTIKYTLCPVLCSTSKCWRVVSFYYLFRPGAIGHVPSLHQDWRSGPFFSSLSLLRNPSYVCDDLNRFPWELCTCTASGQRAHAALTPREVV